MLDHLDNVWPINMINLDSEIDVLVLEDDDDDFCLLELKLKKYSSVKFNISHAVSLKEALDLLHAKKFDAIIADLNVPDSNYQTTIKSLKDALTEYTPIFAVSGCVDSEIEEQVLAYGADDLFDKGNGAIAGIARNIVYKRFKHDIRKNEEISNKKKQVQEMYKFLKKALEGNEHRTKFSGINNCST